jgi:ATP-dependent helicase/nuclease subunit A
MPWPPGAHDPADDPASSQVMVQGIIDCYFQEEGELVLVDYKTSRIRQGRSLEAEKKRIAAQYQTQIDIYRRGLEVTAGKKVRAAYIYLTDCGELVEMES